MQNPLVFGYLLLGFIAGFGFGVVTEPLSGLTFVRIALFFGFILLIALWQWFEYATHKRNLEKWEIFHSKGKWYFIGTRYLLTRGIVMIVLTLAPLLSVGKLNGQAVLPLILTYLIAILGLAFLGYQEWSSCEQEFEILSLRKTIQRFRDVSSTLANGGGA